MRGFRRKRPILEAQNSLQISHVHRPAGEYGWPTSSVLGKIPETDEEKTQLVDVLQDWKTHKYQELVCEPPPLFRMDGS